VNNEEFEKTETVVAALRQAIAEAEKQPVHASDISQECVDETAKSEHEWVGQPDLATVGEVGVWGEEKNT
jgi:ABC-type nitrate/sulfonate/bicarbonate transport system substrate-binding protein